MNLVSQAVLSDEENILYSASKGAVLAMSRSLALSGQKHGILVNCGSPFAFTEGVREILARDESAPGRLDFVKRAFPTYAASQALIWLCCEKMQATGEVMVCGGGVIRRLFMAETRGVRPNIAVPSAEVVKEYFEEWHTEEGYSVPDSMEDSVLRLISLLP